MVKAFLYLNPCPPPPPQKKELLRSRYGAWFMLICVCWIFQSVHRSNVSAAVVPQSKSTELCSSAAVVSQGKSTELCSSAAVVSQGKSTELCSSAAVVPQSKSTEMWTSAALFHHDLWYFRHQTNEHLYVYVIYSEKLINSSQSLHSYTSLKSTHSTKLLQTNHTISLAFK